VPSDSCREIPRYQDPRHARSGNEGNLGCQEASPRLQVLGRLKGHIWFEAGVATSFPVDRRPRGDWPKQGWSSASTSGKAGLPASLSGTCYTVDCRTRNLDYTVQYILHYIVVDYKTRPAFYIPFPRRITITGITLIYGMLECTAPRPVRLHQSAAKKGVPDWTTLFLAPVLSPKSVSLHFLSPPPQAFF
jgi:hypothetical protein